MPLGGIAGVLTYLAEAVNGIELLAMRIDRLERIEILSASHDHDGGDGALIPEAGLATVVQNKLVTNGNSHDHVGGDGGPISGIVTGGDSHDHAGGDGAQIPSSGLATAVQNMLVTNGNSHDHNGGDGAQIPSGGLATAVQNMLVTNGNSHNHDGGDGATLGTNALSNDAVTEAKLDNAVVAKLVTNGNSHNHDGGDGATLGTNAISNGAITEAKLASAVSDQLVAYGDMHFHAGGSGGQSIPTGGIENNAVDDTKVGNRVPMLTRRKGGSSTNWSTAGTTSYTPGMVKIQCGSQNCPANTDTTITFPQSFGSTPLVVTDFTYYNPWFVLWSVGSSSFTINNEFPSNAFTCRWIAIGAE